MRKWEHKVINNPSQGDLQQAGDEGWELVSVVPFQGMTIQNIAFLKRPGEGNTPMDDTLEKLLGEVTYFIESRS